MIVVGFGIFFRFSKWFAHGAAPAAGAPAAAHALIAAAPARRLHALARGLRRLAVEDAETGWANDLRNLLRLP